MKKLLLLACFLICNVSVIQAQQEFAPLGAIWYGTPYSWAPPSAYYTLEVTKDTTVDGNAAKYLKYTQHYNLEATHIEDASFIVWQNQNKIYFYDDNEFKLIYDFDALPGDTLILHTSTKADYYSYGGENKAYRVVVDSIGYFEVNAEMLKSVFTYPVMEDVDTLAEWQMGLYIEKIGHPTSGAFWGHSYYFVLAGWEGELRCYEDNEINYSNSLFNPDASNCILSSTTQLSNTTSIDLYPNPVKDVLYFNVENATIESAIIYNTLGQKIRSLSFDGSLDKISVSQYPKGNYWLKVKTKNGILIKQFSKL